MPSFLEFGGILFWGFAAFLSLLIIAQAREDNTGRASAIFVVLIAFVAILGDTSAIWNTIKAHPEYVAYAFGGYVLTGMLWSIVKWKGYLKMVFRRYDEYRVSWMKENNLKEFPVDPALVQAFRDTESRYGPRVAYARMVRNNKSKITGWIILWPFSMASTVVGDYVLRIFQNAYQAVSGLLQRMSDNMADKYSELN